MPNFSQREMPLLQPLVNAEWVPLSVITGWETYRDAVLWCWTNRRVHHGKCEPDDQALFARSSGMHAPHASRCFNSKTKSPMSLPPGLIPAFESFTGWRGVTQFQAMQSRVTLMEQVIAQRAA